MCARACVRVDVAIDHAAQTDSFDARHRATKPTDQPTDRPTDRPTNRPTNQPTRQELWTTCSWSWPSFWGAWRLPGAERTATSGISPARASWPSCAIYSETRFVRVFGFIVCVCVCATPIGTDHGTCTVCCHLSPHYQIVPIIMLVFCYCCWRKPGAGAGARAGAAAGAAAAGGGGDGAGAGASRRSVSLVGWLVGCETKEVRATTQPTMHAWPVGG